MKALSRAILIILAALALAAPAPAVELKPFAADSLAAILVAKAGRPLVVSFWSTSCAPCREELGRWGAWKKRHPKVDVLLVNVDGADEQADAGRVLDAYRLAGVETWGFADAYAERLRWSVDPAWRGEVPRTHLYDAGHRLTARSGSFEPRELERWAAGLARAGRGGK